VEPDTRRSLQEILGMVLVAAVSAMLAIWLYQQIQPRGDVFSNEDGRRMESGLAARIGAAELGLAKIEAWRGEFSLQRQDLPNRLYRIEAMLEANSSLLADIRKRLDSLEATRLEAKQ